MISVKSMLELFDKMQSGDLTVFQHRCVRIRNRNANCKKCAEACTSGCMSIENNRILVSPGNCIGCGTCATVCPTEALQAQHPSDSELRAKCAHVLQATDGIVVLACQQICKAATGLYDFSKVASVPCLGRIDESILADLSLGGARQIILTKGACESCPHRAGLDTAKKTTETFRTLLDAWNWNTDVRIADRFPSVVRKGTDYAYDEQRRAFFSQLKSSAQNLTVLAATQTLDDMTKGTETTAQKLVKVDNEGKLPQFVPHRRRRLLKDLRQMGNPQDILVETRLWGHVIIDFDRCNSCLMCSTFCPTGALSKLVDENGPCSVGHAPSLCVKCRCCEDICPVDAISLSDEVFAVDLAKGTVEKHEMRTAALTHGGPHSMVNAMRNYIACDQVYKR